MVSVTCSMEQYGCRERVPRREMADHMVKYHTIHLDLLKDCLETTKKEKKEKESEITNLLLKKKKDSINNAKLLSKNEKLDSLVDELNFSLYEKESELENLTDRYSEVISQNKQYHLELADADIRLEKLVGLVMVLVLVLFFVNPLVSVILLVMYFLLCCCCS